jgi:hypothetical protein
MESLDEPNYASAACIWSLYICSRELLRTLHRKVLDKAHISRDLSSAERNLKDEVIRLSLWGENQSARHVVITLALSSEIQITIATFLLNIATILTNRKSAHVILHRVTEQLLELIPLIGEKEELDLISEPTQVFYRQLEENLGDQTYRLELQSDMKVKKSLDALVNSRRNLPSSSVEGLHLSGEMEAWLAEFQGTTEELRTYTTSLMDVLPIVIRTASLCMRSWGHTADVSEQHVSSATPPTTSHDGSSGESLSRSTVVQLDETATRVLPETILCYTNDTYTPGDRLYRDAKSSQVVNRSRPRQEGHPCDFKGCDKWFDRSIDLRLVSCSPMFPLREWLILNYHRRHKQARHFLGRSPFSCEVQGCNMVFTVLGQKFSYTARSTTPIHATHQNSYPLQPPITQHAALLWTRNKRQSQTQQ